VLKKKRGRCFLKGKQRIIEEKGEISGKRETERELMRSIIY
jgi:hypothetical protein